MRSRLIAGLKGISGGLIHKLFQPNSRESVLPVRLMIIIRKTLGACRLAIQLLLPLIVNNYGNRRSEAMIWGCQFYNNTFLVSTGLSKQRSPLVEISIQEWVALEHETVIRLFIDLSAGNAGNPSPSSLVSSSKFPVPPFGIIRQVKLMLEGTQILVTSQHHQMIHLPAEERLNFPRFDLFIADPRNYEIVIQCSCSTSFSVFSTWSYNKPERVMIYLYLSNSR